MVLQISKFLVILIGRNDMYMLSAVWTNTLIQYGLLC